MMIALDPNGRVSLINKKGCEILGYKESEVLGKNWFSSFVPERYREKAQKIFQQLKSGDTNRYSYREKPVVTRTGQERLIAWHNNFLTDSCGNVVGILTSGEDITERRRAEPLARQAERHRSVADLTSGIAHNFNNLLQIVIGNADLGLRNLQSGNFEALKERLSRIVESARFGAETVKRLNRYAHGANDGSKETIEVFDLSSIVAQAVEMSKPWWKTETRKIWNSNLSSHQTEQRLHHQGKKERDVRSAGKSHKEFRSRPSRGRRH